MSTKETEEQPDNETNATKPEQIFPGEVVPENLEEEHAEYLRTVVARSD